ncbi:MAG TPA: chromatin protein Cren7 [Ignisphaera sp.]|nr:chromatin protein Cren7 [Ignisphaera sp.]
MLFKAGERLPKRSAYQCPRCGTVVTGPVKTWQLVAPIPDSRGRITVTVMGMFECPSCGYKRRGVVSKIKVGSEGVEMESRKGRGVKLEAEESAKPREGTVIELSLEDIMSETE